jgi:predicted lipoprotein
MRKAYRDFSAEVYDWSEMDEVAMVAELWPDGKQPVTQAPVIKKEQDKLVMSSATAGASIGYRTLGSQEWQIYSDPIALPNEKVEAKAIRYGYQESVISEFSPN